MGNRKVLTVRSVVLHFGIVISLHLQMMDPIVSTEGYIACDEERKEYVIVFRGYVDYETWSWF